MKFPALVEPIMRANLAALIEAVAEARGTTTRTICRKVAHDDRFLMRIEDGGAFTARVYDQVVARCAIEMPEGARWPELIRRPRPDQISELLGV
jgi:hypothetical protein